MFTVLFYKVSVHLMLRGLIDPAKEVEKLDKKRSALLASIDKLRKAAEVKGDYSLTSLTLYITTLCLQITLLKCRRT
jgi:hypothetical protein